MPLNKKQKQDIEELISSTIEKKLEKYAKETLSMPFLTRLIQDREKVAAYSFIHSLSTSLGMSIYEDVSVIIAEPHCEECKKKHDLGGAISKDQKSVIGEIIRNLRNKTTEPNIKAEIKQVLKANKTPASPQKEGSLADFYMKRDNKEFYFEIKTVKPNIDVFTTSKKKLLEWAARRGRKIYPYLAFPYNPYYPKPYDRFTQMNLVKVDEDFLVGEDYFDFLGGKNTFTELLDIFDQVGKKYKTKLIEKFKEVAKNQH